MEDKKAAQVNLDVQQWTKNLFLILHKSYQVMDILWRAHISGPAAFSEDRFKKLFQGYTNLLNFVTHNPKKIRNANITWLKNHYHLWQDFTLKFLGKPPHNETKEKQSAEKDKRFQPEEWEEFPAFDYMRQTYLLAVQYFSDVLYHAEGLSPKTSKQLRFYTMQFLDALSPSNFIMTNPKVLKITLETAGDNLVKGLDNMLEDLHENEGRFRISMTDPNAFVIGQDLAITPGKVVFQNRLLQLIQYEPSTTKVYEIPLLIFPPWINKYYILDLKPENSFVKSLADQGYTVFMVSWVNPGKELADITFSDYLTDGALTAIEVVQSITKQPKINVTAYCIGGTLLGCVLAYLAKRKLDIINSATFLASLLDFSDPGDIEVFIDEEQIHRLEKHMQKQGYLDGRDMALTFNTLRANDLIWAYYVSNYLEGRDPFPFDLLFWNNDSTHLPATAHSFYLREFYLHNELIKPNHLQLNDVSLDLGLITLPIYAVSTEHDHISPWCSVYKGLQFLNSSIRFVLSGSGHIAGIINSPAKNKYGYRVHEGDMQASAEDWYTAATLHQGSWWPDWYQWLKKQSGKKIEPPTMGNKQFPVIENAPGQYVMKKIINVKRKAGSHHDK